jgi:NAD(P)-dependent dehydrogenase (short-subunit alcohol dehydrogenase family)
MDDISGATAFITGGAQGIGLGMARALTDRGARVAIVDIDKAALDAAREQLGVSAFELDIRNRDAYVRVADAVEDELGPVSILCNNAGVAGAFSLAEMSYELWDLVLGVNLGGTVNGLQTFLPRMMERGIPGHIVNTAAGSGLAAGSAAAGFMYQSSKYGIVGLSETIRIQLRQAGHPIGVTVLCPGPVPTNIIATTMAAVPDSMQPKTAEEAEGRQQVLEIMGAYLAQGVHPDEVGRMVVDAIEHDRLYVHTDRTMWDPIWHRTKALLDAMPAIEAPSTANIRGPEQRIAR